MTIARIRIAGGLADALIIDQAHGDCGRLTDDLGVRFQGDGGAAGAGWSSAPWVLSWDDFEAAYHAMKKARALPPNSQEEGPK
jgi:hypothetical protein